jgi:hypothetical protein
MSTQPHSVLPSVNPASRMIADMAFMETSGSDARKVEAAIRAYLWAEEARLGSIDALQLAPSMVELRMVLHAEGFQ